jgi:hypothetical protein
LLLQQSCEAGDYWDDEWDDDSEGGGTQTAAWTNNATHTSGQVPKSGSAGDVSSIGVCTHLYLVMLGKGKWKVVVYTMKAYGGVEV